MLRFWRPHTRAENRKAYTETQRGPLRNSMRASVPQGDYAGDPGRFNRHKAIGPYRVDLRLCLKATP
jgi:hypothetical protein